MSTGQRLFSSPSFLDIARPRPGLSLVWCALNPKNKLLNTSQKQRQVSLLKSHTKTETKQHKEHNNLGTDKVSIRLSENKENVDSRQESLVFYLSPTGSVFVPFDWKENQAESKR